MRALSPVFALLFLALSSRPTAAQQLRELLTTSDLPMVAERIGAQTLSDVDGDGDLDLIAGGPGWLWLLRNDGDAAFARDAAALPAPRSSRCRGCPSRRRPARSSGRCRYLSIRPCSARACGCSPP